MSHIDRSNFEIASCDVTLMRLSVRVRFEARRYPSFIADAVQEAGIDIGACLPERYIEIRDYLPELGDLYAEIAALPVPSSTLDPLIDPYLEIFDRFGPARLLCRTDDAWSEHRTMTDDAEALLASRTRRVAA